MSVQRTSVHVHLSTRAPQYTRTSVHVHHPVEEGPEQDVGEQPPDEPPREEQPPGFEALVPAAAGLQDEQQGEEERGEEVEDEPV